MLVVTPKGVLGGAEQWLLAVLDAAPRITPVVVMLQEGPLREALQERGVTTEVLPTGASAAQVTRTARRLLGVLDRHSPDIVLASGIKAATAALAPARLLGVPAVWVRHDHSFSGSLGPLAMRLADRTIVVGPPSETDLRHDPELVPPPVLAEPLPAAEARRVLHSLGVPEDGLLRVGILARLARHKGIDTMIRALEATPAHGWRLVVAGDTDPGQAGDERAYLEGLARRAGVSDRVSWLGEVNSAGRLISALDAVAVPTRGGVPGYPEGEAFGMTVVEAYAAGVPVLADPTMVPALHLPGYRDGACPIDCADPHSVAAALGSLADPGLRERLGAKAAAIGARHPRPPQVAAAVTQVLTRTCHQPGAGLTAGPAFSVVSTIRNERPGIDAWLRTIVDQLEAEDEVVLVDGGSTDGTLERLRDWSVRDARVRVIEAPGAGISAGRNLGIETAEHEWIACTDAGCVPDAGWLASFRRAAAEDEVDLVTGVYRAGPLDGRPWELALAAVSYPVPEELRRPKPLDRAYGRLFGRVYDASLPTGRSVAFSKTAWHRAGGYPEDLATAEDVLFGKRAVAAGARAALAVGAAVTWDQRETLTANLRMFRGYGRGDGQSGDRQLVARNLARAAAYTVAPALWLASPRLRPLLLSGAATYLSLPLRRTLGGPRPLTASALVPLMTAARDIAKALGCVEGLRQRQRGAGQT